MGPPFGNPGCVLASSPAPLIGPRSPPLCAGGRSLIFAVKLLAIAVAERFARAVGSRRRFGSENLFRPDRSPARPEANRQHSRIAAIGEVDVCSSTMDGAELALPLADLRRLAR
jgi:hypothetical protein